MGENDYQPLTHEWHGKTARTKDEAADGVPPPEPNLIIETKRPSGYADVIASETPRTKQPSVKEGLGKGPRVDADGRTIGRKRTRADSQRPGPF